MKGLIRRLVSTSTVFVRTSPPSFFSGTFLRVGRGALHHLFAGALTLPPSDRPPSLVSSGTVAVAPIVMTASKIATDGSLAAANNEAAAVEGTAETTTRKPAPSFYRRPLPDTCVALSSRTGRQLFQSALRNGGLMSFFPLMEQHTTQVEPAYCGISTLTVCLNAFAVDPRQNWKGPWRWYEESMLNCCVSLEDVKKTGITMRVFQCLARCQGLTSHTYYAEDEECTLDHFREHVRKACQESSDPPTSDGTVDEKQQQEEEEEGDDDSQLRHILVASYDRRTLGQSGTGHFSPIGAYDSASDSVLILDTARFKYGVHWVSLPLLYEAMKPVDPDSGRSRGYILLTHDDHHHSYTSGLSSALSSSSSPLPISILFRSKMNQFETRREYKRFLLSLQGEPTWNDVLRFWTKDFTTRDYVWTSLDPQVKPCSNEFETLSLLRRVRDLLADSIPAQPPLPRTSTGSLEATSSPETASSPTSSCTSSCRPNGLRSLDLIPEEAIFVAYLAALDGEGRRRQVLEASRYSADEEAVLQLLAEAELVRYAIDLSDQ